MTDVVYDYISMGVDMILTAAILSSIVVLLRSAVVLSAYQSTLQANSDRMNYYRQYNMYDCTENLCMADIQSTLIFYRYELDMTVHLSDGTFIRNDTDTGKFYQQKNFGEIVEVTMSSEKEALPNIVYFGRLISADMKFKSVLAEDGALNPAGQTYQGGVVTGISFTQQ